MARYLRTDNQTKRIRQITLKWEVDTDPDLSWLGEYKSQPGPDDKTIDREAHGDRGRHEYRYFVAAMSGEETGNPKSVEEDYKRMEDYNRQNWYMLGLTAEAQIEVNGIIQTVSSGGLWGIESDSRESYFDEVMEEQKSELREVLKSLGFQTRAINAAMKAAKEKDA